MLTPTYVINYIEKRLGFQFTDIELSHDEILENIRRDTLITFSKYFPYQERLMIDSKKDQVPGYVNRYYLTSESEILNVNRIVGLGILGSDALSTFAIHPTAMAQMMGDPLSMQMSADILSMTKNPITFVYYHPNQVEIAPVHSLSSHYIVIANTIHHNHFGTIPTSLEREFLELAYLDTAMVLYSIRKRFTNMQTSFGSMELNIDDLSSAKDEREELVEKMMESSLKYGKRKKVFIA